MLCYYKKMIAPKIFNGDVLPDPTTFRYLAW